jgi:hypothetical protein
MSPHPAWPPKGLIVTSRLAFLAPACLLTLAAPLFADEPLPKVPDGF